MATRGNIPAEFDEALAAYAKRYGRGWRQKLCIDWSTGKSLHEPEGGILQSIRNTFGSEWLLKYQLPTEG
jgi:hypothetical protein